MCRSSIEELSLVQCLKANPLIKKMVPDKAAASKGLPDKDLLLNGGLYPELHAF